MNQWNMPKDERTQAQIGEDEEKNYQRLLAQWPPRSWQITRPVVAARHRRAILNISTLSDASTKEAAQRLADQIDKFALEQSDTLPNPEFVLDKSRKDT